MDGITFYEIVLNSFKNYVDYANNSTPTSKEMAKFKLLAFMSQQNAKFGRHEDLNPYHPDPAQRERP